MCIIQNLYNQHMGPFASKSIKFATANYSGITMSPFEFYSQDQSATLNDLNEIFRTLFSKLNTAEFGLQETLKQYTNYDDLKKSESGGREISNDFDWKINSIDKSMHRGRYCAQYRKDVGIQNGRIISNRRYFHKWDSEFNKNSKYVKIQDPSQAKISDLNSPQKKKKEQNTNPPLSLEDQKKVCRVFDFLIFKTFVEYAYKKTSNSEFEVTFEDRYMDESRQSRLNRKKAYTFYEQFLDRFHDKPYLSHKLKFMKIKQLYEGCDVVFLQDCSHQLINEIKNEGDITIIEPISTKGDSYILINSNRKPFTNLYDARKIMSDPDSLLSEDKFNYGDSYPSICLTDDFLLMCVHFSSRSVKYKQFFVLMKHLQQIRKRYPDLKIIVGGDFNFNIQTDNTQQIKGYKDTKKSFWEAFSCYPSSNKITSRKKRTWLQSQASKAEKNDESSRDYLVSSHPMEKWKLIDSWVGEGALLPTQKHPFDHFFISAQLPKA